MALRMAGSRLAALRGREVYRSGDEAWYSFAERPRYDFSSIDKKGSVEGVVEGLRRISGGVAQELLPESVTSTAFLDNPVQFRGWINDMQGKYSVFTGQGVKGLAGQGISYGRMMPSEIALLQEYMRRGLWMDARSAAGMDAAKESLMREAIEKQRADKADDMWRMLGNAVRPHLDDRAVASGLTLYRGDVVPLEMAAKVRMGDFYGTGMSSGSVPLSYSIEPFQAYRYTQFNRDGRKEKAQASSPSGQVVKRIIELETPASQYVPVLNPDYAARGNSEFLYPTLDFDLVLTGREQVYNAADPAVPLLWEMYSPRGAQ